MRVADELTKELVADCLVAAGARAVQESDQGLTTHFAPPADPDAFVAGLFSGLDVPVQPADVTWRWQEQKDWEDLWRQGLAPRRIGERLVVRPSWTPYDAGPDELVITLDPGMAFGTAEHATTRGSIRLLEQTMSPGDVVADVGTGTGILAMAAALLGAERVDALDVDPYACAAARENAQANGVADRIGVTLLDAASGAAPQTGGYDGLIVNIEWIRLRPLLPDLVRWIRDEGWLIVSGVLEAQQDEALAMARELGLVHRTSDVEDEWWAASFRLGQEPG